MSPRELDIVTLENFNGGIVPVRVEQAMADVMANIQDLNRPAEAERKITITLTFKPVNEDRRDIATGVKVTTNLVDRKDKLGQIFVGKDAGRPVFRTFDPQQTDLELDNPQVTDINRKEATS